MASEDPARVLHDVPEERMLDAARATARDPGAPLRPWRKERLLLAGFVLCLVIAVVTVVMPELSDGDAAHKQSPAVPASTSPTK
jgi:hypothetical protein